jgi:hypothetical protein
MQQRVFVVPRPMSVRARVRRPVSVVQCVTVRHGRQGVVGLVALVVVVVAAFVVADAQMIPVDQIEKLPVVLLVVVVWLRVVLAVGLVLILL